MVKDEEVQNIQEESNLCIDERTKLKCWCCKKQSTIRAWDLNTMKEATCVEALKEYISLKDPRAYTIEEDTIYKCPVCGAWTEGAKVVAAGNIDLDEYN